MNLFSEEMRRSSRIAQVWQPSIQETQTVDKQPFVWTNGSVARVKVAEQALEGMKDPGQVSCVEQSEQ